MGENQLSSLASLVLDIVYSYEMDVSCPAAGNIY